MNATTQCPDPREVSAGWMTEAMREAGVAGSASVDSVEFEGFIGDGQMARNARYRLTWDDGEGRPASVVGKFPAEDETTRATAFASGAYRKEHVFYTDLQPTVSVPTPALYVSRYDEAAQRFVILMEDLSSSETGDQFAGLSVDQAALAVEAAVGFHAPHWGNAQLEALVGQTRNEGADLVTSYYEATHEAAVARLGDTVDAATIGLIRDYAPHIRSSMFTGQTPATLMHLDYRPENFLFGATPDAPPIVVVDWQGVGVGRAAVDIAYVIGGAFEPEERASVERALVADYAGRLRAAGIAYSDEEAWIDYRIGTLHGIIISTIALVVAEQTERGDEMLTTMLKRHAQHVLDLDALALVRG